ncbi:hypothetical protein, partial [Chitinophaga sp. GbtcB8]|uniref:hypothetical protein n=1 Tax=Chitinophaga sp. GbtcB8 TaxID=2824753 RepID=UPI001C30DAA9
VKFTDVTSQAAPALQPLGLVCEALFTDYGNDGYTDLQLAGEWMPPVFLHNNNQGRLLPARTGLEAEKGWWGSLVSG